MELSDFAQFFSIFLISPISPIPPRLLRRHQGFGRGAQAQEIAHARPRRRQWRLGAKEALLHGHVHGKEDEAAQRWLLIPGLEQKPMEKPWNP